MRNTCLLLAVVGLLSVGCSEGDDSQESQAQTNDASEPGSDSSGSQVTPDQEPPAGKTPAGKTAAEETGSGEPVAGDPPADGSGDQSRFDTLHQEARALMSQGKREEGYETAKKLMQVLIEQGNDLAWIILESDLVGDKRVDVHFNMGPRERQMPDSGIVRPLSFRVWSKGNELIRILDFEIGRFDGKSMTAAIGQMTESGHANYGIIDVHASYDEIKKKVHEIVAGD